MASEVLSIGCQRRTLTQSCAVSSSGVAGSTPKPVPREPDSDRQVGASATGKLFELFSGQWLVFSGLVWPAYPGVSKGITLSGRGLKWMLHACFHHWVS